MKQRLTVAMMLATAAAAAAAAPVCAQRPGGPAGAPAEAARRAGTKLLGQPVGTSSRPRAAAARPGRTRLLGVPAPGNARAPRPRGLVDPAALRRAVLEEANRMRVRAGVRPLERDARLERAARRYSGELARRREVEHRSPTPGLRTFRDRIRAAGARARVAGENLARLTAGQDRLARRVVRAWLRSPGHRSNLLDPVFVRTGIGIALDADGIWYITQYYASGP